jgi:hypothetical protein
MYSQKIDSPVLAGRPFFANSELTLSSVSLSAMFCAESASEIVGGHYMLVSCSRKGNTSHI